MTKQNTLKGLYSVRLIAFICVFLHHSGINILKSGSFGASCFLVLSGFLLTYNHKNDDFTTYNLFDCFNYAIKRILNFYFIYVICNLLYIPIYFFSSTSVSISTLVKTFILNCLMIQEWFPISLRSLNPTSWFVSCLFICYLIFPLFIRYQKKHEDNNKLIIILLLFFSQILIGYIASKIGFIFSNKVTFDITYWLIYTFPLSRLIDFLIGCYLSLIFLLTKEKIKLSEKAYSILEIFAIVFCLICIALYVYIFNYESYQRWYSYVVLFTPCSCFLIYIFASSKGIVTKILNNRVCLFICECCRYAFLIHTVVFEYTKYIFRAIGINDLIIISIVCFCISILLSKFCIQLSKKLRI